MQNKKLISVKEFASMYNIGHNKAYEMVNCKDFPKIKVGKKILILSEKIDEFLYSKIGTKF